MSEVILLLLTGAAVGIMATICVIFVFFMGVRITINVADEEKTDANGTGIPLHTPHIPEQ